MRKKSRAYEIGLHERLRDGAHAEQYVRTAAEDSIEGFLLALRDVAEANKGMSRVATEADVNRVNLYRMLSEDGNPQLKGIWAVVKTLGLHITVESDHLSVESPKPSSPLPADDRKESDATSPISFGEIINSSALTQSGPAIECDLPTEFRAFNMRLGFGAETYSIPAMTGT